MAREQDTSFTFEIKAFIGVIGNRKNGWRKELNIVSWNGGQPKFDIREWSADHHHMSKGITLYLDEMQQLVKTYSIFANDRRLRNVQSEANQKAADEAFAEIPKTSDRDAAEAARQQETERKTALEEQEQQKVQEAEEEKFEDDFEAEEESAEAPQEESEETFEEESESLAAAASGGEGEIRYYPAAAAGSSSGYGSGAGAYS